MNNTNSDSNSDQLMVRVAEAFESQPIPARPSDSETLAFLAGNVPDKVDLPPRILNAGDSSPMKQFLASIPVVAVSVVVIFALWWSTSETNQVAPDAVVDLEPDRTDPSVAQERPQVLNDDTKVAVPKTDVPADDVPKNQDNVPKNPDTTVQPKQVVVPNKNGVAVDEDVVNRVYYVKFFKAEAAAKDLKRFFGVSFGLGDGRLAKDAVSVDQRLNALVVRAKPSVQKEVTQFLSQYDVQSPKTLDVPKGSLLAAVEFFNSCVGSGKVLAESKAVVAGVDEETLGTHFAALRKIGMPKSCVGVAQGPPGRAAWLSAPTEHAYTYSVDYSKLIADARPYVNTLLDDELFDDLMDGILRDKEGPMIDLRRVIKLFEKELVFVGRVSATNTRWMLAAPIKDEREMESALKQMFSVEPDYTLETYRGVNLHIVDFDSSDGVPASGVCVAEKWLLAGDEGLVRSALDRRAK